MHFMPSFKKNKTYQAQVLLPIYSCVCNHPLECGADLSGAILLKHSPLPAVISCKSSSARNETLCLLLFSILRLLSGLSLHGSCVCCRNHCELIRALGPLRMDNHCFFVFIYYLWLFQFFRLLFYNVPWGLGERLLIQVSHLGLGILCILWVSVLTAN